MFTLTRSKCKFVSVVTPCLIAFGIAAPGLNAQVTEVHKNCSTLSSPGKYPDYEAAPIYSIERRETGVSQPPVLLLQISVAQSALNSGSMTRLACKLATEFGRQTDINALIFDDKKAAKSLALGFTDQREYGVYLWHLKAHYVRKQEIGLEFIDFLLPEVQDELLSVRRVRVWIEHNVDTGKPTT